MDTDKAMGIGLGVIGQVAGGIYGAVTRKQNDERQITQQGKLINMQKKAQEELAESQRMKQMQMWRDTNYAAQTEEMRKAGLNPALMYGIGGGGGTTAGAGQATNVTGGSAPVGGGENNAGAGMGMQLASQLGLMQAQKENIEADTANKKASAGGTQASTEGKTIENRIAAALENKTIEGKSAGIDKEIIDMQEANANWEALKTAIGNTSLEDEKNPLVQAKQAELKTKIASLDNLIQERKNKEKDGTLKDDEHDLNEINKQINSFTADLTELGINNTTTTIILKMLGALAGIRVKGK